MYRLIKNVQVRRESWGLLFYSHAQHRVLFVRSGDWLYPQHFDGTWTSGRLVENIANRTGTQTGIIQRSVQKLTENLIKNGMITYELR